ncbi:MAG TPA: 2,3-bisphosphoglycerate-independent phosphoglycerate mutase, partial [Bacteroidales bacterium]|nr:2,3-bisphosphoglycerate-independent phosphoglycerate mutase [Bacteroidales bacterium]
SEVGHLNIGAGRVVYQDLVRINKEVKSNAISNNPILKQAFSYAKAHNKAVHFVGLIGNGGVHSMSSHLFKLCDITRDYNLDKVFVHALTDGRDTDPMSGKGFTEDLLQHIQGTKVKVASLAGRYYTMDRDKRWERIKQGYDALIYGIGEYSTDLIGSIQKSYNNGITDEFIKPIIMVDENGKPVAVIQDNDVVICFNFRTDRLRQISIALTQKDMPEAGMKTIPLQYYTMTRYDESFENVHVIYDKQNVQNTLGEVLSQHGLKQLRIAETEKYAHVTFFFSGGREDAFDGETRIMIPSPKVATYDLQPEMSAYKVKDAVIEQLDKNENDFICLNFANGDMVGHTGVYNSIFKAVQAVDTCVGEVVAAARKNNYEVVIIADHGNADYATNDDGSPNTAHSLNPVPIIVISNRVKRVTSGILADVAPTVLHLMEIQAPIEMTGKVLIEKYSCGCCGCS